MQSEVEVPPLPVALHSMAQPTRQNTSGICKTAFKAYCLDLTACLKTQLYSELP